jgi:hypothetical protein
MGHIVWDKTSGKKVTSFNTYDAALAYVKEIAFRSRRSTAAFDITPFPDWPHAAEPTAEEERARMTESELEADPAWEGKG